MALTDEAYAAHSARHGYGEDHSPRQAINKPTGKTRQQEFKAAGIHSEADAKALCLAVRTAADTKCFLGAKGRETYANNRLNAIHISNPKEPHRSTIFINSDPNRTATQRLEVRGQEERKRTGVPCHIRIGGSKALEADRVADRKAKEPVAQKQVERQRQTRPNQQEGTRQKGVEAEKSPREAVEQTGDELTAQPSEAIQAQDTGQGGTVSERKPWTPEERVAKIAAEEARQAAQQAERGIGGEDRGREMTRD